MRTVLMTAAAATFLLGFAAHGAEMPTAPVVPATACIAGSGTLSPTLGAAEESNCCSVNGHCSQYISTQKLIVPPGRGRT
jgi:hypothetical protein